MQVYSNVLDLIYDEILVLKHRMDSLRFFILALKTMPSGHGQSSKALPFEGVIAISQVELSLQSQHKEESNELTSKTIT